jgi:hypothetical protein
VPAISLSFRRGTKGEVNKAIAVKNEMISVKKNKSLYHRGF